MKIAGRSVWLWVALIVLVIWIGTGVVACSAAMLTYG